MTTFRAGAASDVGQIRSNNQDSNLIVDAVSLYAVADGMGGHQGGEVASAIAVETLEAVITEPTVDSIVEAVKEANRRIFSRAADADELRGMGTTLVAIALVNRGEEDEEVAWVNVGDSRVYLLRDGELVQLSQDHSLVEDLRRGGQLSEEEAAVHPQRNILTRALGIDEAVQVDTDSVMPFTGDRFLLCSDGLFNEVERATIVETLTTHDDPDAAAGELVRLANQGGGRDNITCVVVDVTEDGGRSAQAAAAAAAEATTSSGGGDGGDGGDASGDGASPTATTVETPAVQGDPAVADVDPTPPAGLPLPPNGDGATSAPDGPPGQDDTAPTEALAAPVPPSGGDGHPSPANGSDGPAPAGSSDGTAGEGQSLPFGRQNEDLYADMNKAGGRHWALTVLGVIIVLALLGGGAYLAGSWWANRTYFLAADDSGTVQIYRGQPGGFLIFDPELQDSPFDVSLDGLTEPSQQQVEDESIESSSYRSAQSKLGALAEEGAQSEPPTTTESTTTTEPTSTTSTTEAPASSRPPSSSTSAPG